MLNQITRNETVPNTGPGKTVQLFVEGEATTWRVVGIAQERQSTAGVYATDAGFAAATGRTVPVNEIRIATDRHDERTRRQVADAVDSALEGAGIRVKAAASVSRSEAISEGHLAPIVAIIVAIALAMGVIGGIGLGSTMGASVLERTREFGIMHAVGARPEAVRRIVVAEGVFLALASCVAAIIPALLLTALLGAGLGSLFMSAPLPFRVSLPAAGIWVALVLLIAALATEAAAVRASRISVREALAYL